MKSGFDTIVLGLGAAGSAALWQLAEKGSRVLGIDRYSPPHTYGSTHGDTRITRQAVGEGREYTPLSLRSYELWQGLERETGKSLLTVTGGLIVSSKRVTVQNHVSDFFQNTLEAARQYNIRHDVLDAKQIRAKFPPFTVQDDEVGYYEHNAGFLRPEECVRAHLAVAEKHGAVVHRDERVLDFADHGVKVTVRTDRGVYEAARLIVCAGPWLPEFLQPPLAKLFTITRQVLYWFDVKGDIARFQPGQFPIFVWELQGDKHGIYGFPAIDGKTGGIKIATEQYAQITTPGQVTRDVGDDEKRHMFENFVAPYFPDIRDKCLRAAACLYTNTPDAGFVIDRHPDMPSVMIVSPCSGHGFKHAAAVGEMLAEIVMHDKSRLEAGGFCLKRFAI